MESSSLVMEDGMKESLVKRLRHFLVTYCEPPEPLIPPSSEGEGSSGRCVWRQKIDCMYLLSLCPELSEMLFMETMQFMQTVRSECMTLCAEAGRHIKEDDISIRLTHLPPFSNQPLPLLPRQGGQLVQVCGSIVRMGAKKVVPLRFRFMCPRCRRAVEVLSDPLDRTRETKPRCEQPSCKQEELQVVGHEWMDYAECRLQPRSHQSGKLPRSITVTLEDDLSTHCTVGQFVEVVGILYLKWSHMFPNGRPVVEPTVRAINLLPMEAYRGAAIVSGQRSRGTFVDRPKFNPDAFYGSFEQHTWARNVALVSSVCPHLAGLYAPRMSVLLAALGGANTAGKSSMHVRSTIHCLYVGDPSTGKSQLLSFAASVAPRSTSTTGMGSTSAGLTVAAAKENGEWVLEPGALVLSDGGTCVIDELRTVSPADRASLHEAMEQQTISVAKAGLVTKLRSVCSVLSACNPPSQRNGRATIGVGGPLLSRFDFIFLLWDTPQPELDGRIAEHVLACSGPAAAANARAPLTAEEVAQYLWWVRRKYAGVDGPLLSDRAADVLAKYYDILRARGATPTLDDAVPVTVRLLESLVRITQAHAKLHLKTVCSVEDVAMAIFLMERTAYGVKCPLVGLGPDIYSSSRCLDDVFLSHAPKDLATQERVLEMLIDLIDRYPTNGGGSSRNSGPSTSPQDYEASQGVARLSAEVNAVFSTPRSFTQYPTSVASRSSNEPAEVEALLNSQRLSTGGQSATAALTPSSGGPSPQLTPQTVVPATPTPTPEAGQEESSRPPKRKRDAEEIMAFLRFKF